MKLRRSLVVATFASAALGGCGGSRDEGQTVTIRETVASPQATTTVQAEPVPDTTTAAASDNATIAVPNVVGMDHQLAQDTMQAAGLYSLDEEDATGAGRMLLFDRNWVVVSQDPPAGTSVAPDETITLRSKKDDE